MSLVSGEKSNCKREPTQASRPLTMRSPVHLASPQYQRRWQAEDYVRLDPNQGCRSKILELGLQEG